MIMSFQNVLMMIWSAVNYITLRRRTNAWFVSGSRRTTKLSTLSELLEPSLRGGRMSYRAPTLLVLDFPKIV